MSALNGILFVSAVQVVSLQFQWYPCLKIANFLSWLIYAFTFLAGVLNIFLYWKDILIVLYLPVCTIRYTLNCC